MYETKKTFNQTADHRQEDNYNKAGTTAGRTAGLPNAAAIEPANPES